MGWSWLLHAAPHASGQERTARAEEVRKELAGSAKPTPCCGARRKPFAATRRCGALLPRFVWAAGRSDPRSRDIDRMPGAGAQASARTYQLRDVKGRLTRVEVLLASGLLRSARGLLERVERSKHFLTSTGSGQRGVQHGLPEPQGSFGILRACRPRKSGAAPWLTGRPRARSRADARDHPDHPGVGHPAPGPGGGRRQRELELRRALRTMPDGRRRYKLAVDRARSEGRLKAGSEGYPPDLEVW